MLGGEACGCQSPAEPARDVHGDPQTGGFFLMCGGRDTPLRDCREVLSSPLWCFPGLGRRGRLPTVRKGWLDKTTHSSTRNMAAGALSLSLPMAGWRMNWIARRSTWVRQALFPGTAVGLNGAKSRRIMAKMGKVLPGDSSDAFCDSLWL